MSATPFYDPAAILAQQVDAYQRGGDLGTLLDSLKTLAAQFPPESLKAAVKPYQQMPEVVIPVRTRVAGMVGGPSGGEKFGLNW